MWGFNAVLGRYKADHGDRFRTAAARIKAGPLSIGINLFTGDPGREGGINGVRQTDVINGHETYVIGKNGEDPDKYRAGVFYVGIGSLKVGWNSEGIRNCFQNKLIHEPGGYPYLEFWILNLASIFIMVLLQATPYGKMLITYLINEQTDETLIVYDIFSPYYYGKL
jgi:hypothetical protein